MADRLVTNKSLIDPVYEQKAPSQSIDLGTTPAEFTCKDKTCSAIAKVELRFTPHERLLFVLPNVTNDPFFGFAVFNAGGKGSLKLTDRNTALEAFCTSAGQDGLVLMPTTSVVSVSPPSDNLTAAIIHLFNFPEIFGPDSYIIKSGEPPLTSTQVYGCARLKADGWVITIAATNKTDAWCKALDAQGGYMITHVGRIEREDGGIFTDKQLGGNLVCLHYFLSFALGRWAGVALPIGFDSAGSRVFEQWGLPSAAAGPWNGSTSWFDSHHSNLLSEVFPGFVALWKDHLWHGAITTSLYWYLGANDRGTGIGVDTGLILAQTALELLAWVYCVEHKKMISREAFGLKGLSAADRLRVLVSALGIPLELPSHLPALNSAIGRKWTDAMDAITGIRNAVVHPHIEKKLQQGSYYEAWSLSLWYVDMVLLRLCGHNGKYANRLAKERYVGQVEDVPWVKTDKKEVMGQ